jgi:hypothetical protein
MECVRRENDAAAETDLSSGFCDTDRVMKISRGFIAALGGIGMTLLAWFGSWAWPGWPASLALDVLGKYADFPELPRMVKATVVVLLIIINVGVWGAVMRVAMLVVPKPGSSVRTSTSLPRS